MMVRNTTRIPPCAVRRKAKREAAHSAAALRPAMLRVRRFASSRGDSLCRFYHLVSRIKTIHQGVRRERLIVENAERWETTPLQIENCELQIAN